MNFQDFNKPPRWSVISEHYRCISHELFLDFHFLSISHPPTDLVTDYNDLSGWIRLDGAGGAQSWELKPFLVIPPDLTSVDPAWKYCSRWAGIRDPPRPLVSINGWNPAGMSAQSMIMPKPTVTPAASVIHSTVPAMVRASPAQPARQTSAPQPTAGGNPVDPTDPTAILDNSGKVAIGSSTISPVGPAMTAPGTTISVLPSNGGVLVNGKPVSAPKSVGPPAKLVAGIVAAGKTWTPAGSLALAVGGQALSIGGNGANIGGMPISLHSDGLVAGSSTLVLPVNNQVPGQWTVAGQTFTKLGDGTVAAGGKTHLL